MLKNTKDAQRAVGFYKGGEPPLGEFFATPSTATEQLLNKVKFGNLILEPCCGNGAISKILIQSGYEVISRDLYDWGYGETGKDFLTEPVIEVDAVVTNPPFRSGLEFTERALACTKAKSGKVAMLNRIQWLESAKRKKLFENNPLEKVIIFSKRIPRFNRYDFVGKSSTSLLCFAWFVFNWKYNGSPQLEWF